MAKKYKILILFPFLPKYDIEFLDELAKDPNFEIYVLTKLIKSNDLYCDDYY